MSQCCFALSLSVASGGSLLLDEFGVSVSTSACFQNQETSKISGPERIHGNQENWWEREDSLIISLIQILRFF